MKKQCILYVILLISTHLFAQERTIKGTVKDQDGKPIESVAVQVKGSEISTQTDINGTYEIKIPSGDYTTLTFSHPDKEDASATIGLYDKLDIEMYNPGEGTSDMSLEELLNMDVITASKTGEKLSDAPGVLSVLSRDEIERFEGTTLRDMLERIPGLIGSGAGVSNRTTIAVRGDQIKNNSSHILILLNGRPIREVEEGGTNTEIFETFPVNIIERIEVIKGPGSVLYGSDAFSGVINVITRKAEKTGVSVSGIAQNGGGGASGDITLKSGGLSIIAGGRYLKKEEWSTPYEAHYTSPAPPPVYVVNVDSVLNLTFPDKGGGYFVRADYKNFNIMTSYNDWTSSYITGVETGEINTRKIFNNIGYNFQMGDKFFADYNVTLTNTNMDGTPRVIRECYNLVLEFNNTLIINDKSKLVLGGAYNRNKGIDKTSEYGETDTIAIGSLNGLALYAQLDYKVLENLKLIGGIQVNKVENIDVDYVPRVGLIWYPISRVSFKALYSEAFRAPSINETKTDYLGGIFKGNPNLRPEKVANADLSVSYQGERSQLGLSFFRSKFTDNIELGIDMSTFTVGFSNIGEMVYTGVELEGKHYVNQSLFFSGSFMYQTNKNDSIENLSSLANFGFKAGISYIWDKGITIGLFNIYQGSPDDKFIDDYNPYQGSYDLLHLNSKFNINSLFNLTFKPVISLLVNVDNLLDKPHFGYNIGGITNRSIPIFPGRAIYLGANIKF